MSDTVDRIARSLALIASGIRPGIADARAAGPFLSQGATKVARNRWRRRMRITT